MGENKDCFKTASPTEPGVSRKRVRRACDECRLHKARCDGRQGCETCIRHNRECSYNLLTTDCKGSAARIHILERRLIRAREEIQHLKPRQLPKSFAANLHHVVSSRDKPNLPATLDSIVMESGSSEATGTGSVLIEALLEPLSYHEDIKFLLRSDTARQILCSSTDGVVSDHLLVPFFHLPPRKKMLEVACLAFNKTFGLPSIISEECFYAAAQKLYDVNPIIYAQEDTLFIPLFCGVMALGMLSCSGVELRYHNIVKESQYYFESAASTINKKPEYSSVSELQVGLTLVLYLVNTSKLDLARRSLRLITSSAIFHTMYQASTIQSSETPQTLLWVVYYLDSHISSFLGVTAQLNCPASATFVAINTAIWNIAIYKRSESTFLLSVSLAMAIESLRLIKRMISDVVTDPEFSTSLPEQVALSTRLQRWAEMEVELGILESAVRRVFPDDVVNPQISLARSELLMYLHISQVTLHHKFLLLHSQSLPMNDLQQVNKITKRRACVIAASSAISSVSSRMDSLQTNVLTWLSAYTVFISALTLLVAKVSLTKSEDYMQHNIEHTVGVAFQILKHANYGASQNRLHYMNFLLAISAKTKAQAEQVLRNVVSVASTTGNSSGRFESSMADSSPDLRFTFQQYGRNSSESQQRSSTEMVNLPEYWRFDG